MDLAVHQLLKVAVDPLYVALDEVLRLVRIPGLNAANFSEAVASARRAPLPSLTIFNNRF